MRQVSLLLVLSGALCLPACKTRNIEPMPNVMPSFGMLLRTETLPLGSRVQLRRYDLLQGALGNEFYPFNVPGAKLSDRLVPKLFVWQDLSWQFLDFAEMPRADVFNAAGLSPDGKRLIYERPDVAEGERNIPRLYAHDRRTYRAVLYDLPLRRRYVLDCYTEVYGLSSASHWKRDGLAVAFTTTCAKADPPTRALVVLDPSGVVILDADSQPNLIGLEFIAWRSDGRKIAALQPAEAGSGGRGGGLVVEVDVQARTLRDVGEITSLMAFKYIFAYDRLIRWDSKGNLTVRK